ncbi:MAG: TMEM165/GDT1 family protein [Actinobacteria bacterium]|nr:TMEM165/GDT1 family protein [Actinomycetota bacterium]
MHAFLLSLAVIFVAELGDKSQLMALAFATRYRPLPILIGLTISTALVHALSVLIGVVIGAELPTTAISVISGIMFLGFGLWTFRGDRLDDDDVALAERDDRSAVVAASIAFFLAEFGDKTMLATITLATKGGAFGTWLGSTVGMIAADALAIGVGAMLGARLPEKAIRIGAGTLFLVFGVVLIVEAL